MKTNKITKALAYGLMAMGVVHVIATFTPVIAGKLEPLNESGRLFGINLTNTHKLMN